MALWLIPIMNDDRTAGFYRGEGLNNNGDPASYNRDSVTGVQIGITHKF